MKAVIGIDKGTTATKAVVFDAATGAELGSAHHETAAFHDHPGWHEEDMELTFDRVTICIRDAMAAADITGAEVIGVGVSGHMGGLWALDGQGNPCGRAIAWPDARAVDLLQEWDREGLIDEIYEISGNAPIPGITLALLGWIARHEPERLDQISTVFFAKDYVNFRLTGQIATDESDLSFFPCDIRNRSHSDRLFEIAGVGALRDCIAPVRPTGATVGHVSDEAAALTGLKPGTPVTTGAGDAVAAALGAGAVAAGQAVTVIGTSFMNNLTTDHPVMEPRGVGFLFLMPGGNWQRLMANTGGGAICLDWAMEAFCADRLETTGKAGLLQELNSETAALPPLSGGIIAHPYFNTAGMSAPRFDPHARGSLFGLDTSADATAVVRAVMEGVALSMAECYDALNATVTDIRITGGGARSALWRQMCAASVNRPLLVPEVEETGALGVALLAAVAGGAHPDIDAAARAMVRITATVDPDPATVAAYDAAHGVFRDLGQALSSAWSRRAALVSKYQTSTENP